MFILQLTDLQEMPVTDLLPYPGTSLREISQNILYTVLQDRTREALLISESSRRNIPLLQMTSAEPLLITK